MESLREMLCLESVHKRMSSSPLNIHGEHERGLNETVNDHDHTLGNTGVHTKRKFSDKSVKITIGKCSNTEHCWISPSKVFGV